MSDETSGGKKRKLPPAAEQYLKNEIETVPFGTVYVELSEGKLDIVTTTRKRFSTEDEEPSPPERERVERQG